MHLSETHHPVKNSSRRDPLKPVPLSQDFRPPFKPSRTRAFEYESPRSTELSEDGPPLLRAYTELPKQTKANPLPGTIRKDLKNPLTNGRMGTTSFSGSQDMLNTIRETNVELRAKIVKTEDEIKKWRRLCVLTTEKEKQIEQLQLSIKLAEQEKAELQRSVLSPGPTSVTPSRKAMSTQHWEEIQQQMDSLRLRLTTFLANKPM